jgi:hypothetical protein
VSEPQVRAFFAYPASRPALAETIRTASGQISSSTLLITTWEQARVGGKIIIDEVCSLINESDLFLADLTGLNSNVMFELGYAVAANKRIWLVLDTTRDSSKRDYEQLRLLTGIGYCSYANSYDIRNGFFKDQPSSDLKDTVLERHIKPLLAPGLPSSGIFYLRSKHDTDADRKVSEAVVRYNKNGLPYTIDDPNEARLQPLAWYAEKVYSALAVLAHLSSETREGARAHNARHAFVCGLAYGFAKPLLMLAEHDYTVPLDYKDLLVHYTTARECGAHAASFLDGVLARYRNLQLPLTKPLEDYIAENESSQLSEYFIETSDFQAALAGRHAIFVGRKGTGKTANLIRLASVLREDKRNLVVVIQPVGYDLSGVTRLLRKYTERDAKGYLVDSLWKFLIYSEVAQAAALSIVQRPDGVYTPAEQELLDIYHSEQSPLHDDFAVRLERALESLLPLPESGGIEETRVAISEVLHSNLLIQLRRLLGEVLATRERVAVLVDNLDKAWELNSDLVALLRGLERPDDRFCNSSPHTLSVSDWCRTEVRRSIVG